MIVLNLRRRRERTCACAIVGKGAAGQTVAKVARPGRAALRCCKALAKSGAHSARGTTFTAIGSFQRKRGSLILVEIKNMRQRSAIPHIVIAKNKNLTTLQASKNLLGVRSAAEREITEGINDVC